jgi:hypothetical protein
MFALVVNPTTDVRSEPKFKSERIHQLVFGEIVEVIGYSEGSDYVKICDVRINYCGYVNRHTIHFLSEEEYEFLLRLNVLKVTIPFCKTYGAVQFMLPFGSRLYFDKKGSFLLPDGRYYFSVDDPIFHAKSVVDVALQFLGVPYLWGGTSSYGFDCSGFVNRLYDVTLNVNLPRDASEQEQRLNSTDKVKPGDLLYMEGHVMMYMGDEMIIHANGHDMCVSTTDLVNDEYGRYLGSKIRKVCRID